MYVTELSQVDGPILMKFVMYLNKSLDGLDSQLDPVGGAAIKF